MKITKTCSLCKKEKTLLKTSWYANSESGVTGVDDTPAFTLVDSQSWIAFIQFGNRAIRAMVVDQNQFQVSERL